MIRRGQEWARPFPGHREAALGWPRAKCDAEVARHAAAGQEIVVLVGGDLHRTLGSPRAERIEEGTAMAFDIDLGVVRVDGGPARLFAAHLIAGSQPWWRRRTVVVMNAAFVGAANLGPRAHPGDGFLDVTDGRLGWRDRRRARQRWGAGAHLPHPALRTTRTERLEIDLGDAVPLWLDGVRIGTARYLDLEVRPQALTVVC
jgi:hypothetical protein